MAQQSSYPHIQAVTKQFQVIILDFLAAKKFWTDVEFLRLVHKQSLYLESNAIQTSYEYHTFRDNVLYMHTQH